MARIETGKIEMYGYSGFGWIWLLWIGVVFLMFSSVSNWGYTYRVQPRFGVGQKGALDILDERCARGEIAGRRVRAHEVRDRGDQAVISNR